MDLDAIVDGVFGDRPIDPKRPRLANPDGSFSTEETIGIEDGGRHVNIPTIIGGVRRSPEEAIQAWRAGRNPEVGSYATREDADAAAASRSSRIGTQFTAGKADIAPEPSIGERVVNAVGDFFEKSRLSRFASVMDEPGTELERRRERRDYAAAQAAKTPPSMTVPTGPLIQPTGGALEAAASAANQAGFRLGSIGATQQQILSEFLGLPELAAEMESASRDYRRRAGRIALGHSDEPVVETGTRLDAIIPSPRDLGAGLAQTLEQAPNTAGAVLGAMTGNAPGVAAGLTPFFLSTSATGTREGREAGMPLGPAMLYGVGQGLAETLPEAIPGFYFGRALPGLKALMQTPAGPAELGKFLVGGYAAEMTNEQMSTVANWAVDRLTRDPTATPERLQKDIQDTVKQTLVMVPAMTAVGAATRIAAERGAGITPPQSDPMDVLRAKLQTGQTVDWTDIDAVVDRMFETQGAESAGEVSSVPRGTSDVQLAQLGDRTLTKGTKARVELQPDLEGGPSPFPVSEQAARERLDRALSRPEEVGAPANPRTVLRDEQGEFAVGQIGPDDWARRVKSTLTLDELAEARTWYSQLHDILTPLYGEEAPRYALAWLLSQQQESPSGGMRNVLRASDLARGLPQIKRAGLNQDNLVRALKGETPEGGIGAKLLDFIDSELGTKTRTVMGRDARGGAPAAIDVWAARDVGRVDSATMNYIRKRFGEAAAKRLKQEPESLGESQYEYGSRFYNGMAERLNRVGFNGGGWTAREVQAVGWAAMQKALGSHPEFVRDIIGKNTRRVSLGLETGEGAPRQEVFSREEAAERIGRVANLVGVKLLKQTPGTGAYLASTEAAYQLDAFASPESVRDFMDALGYAFQQTSVIATRSLKSGKQMAIDVEADFGDRATEFFNKFLEYAGTELAPGFQQTESGIRFLNFGGHWSQRQQSKMRDALEQASQDLGIDVRDVVAFNVELQETKNDWTKQKAGEAYLDSLRKRGRLRQAEELARQFGPGIERADVQLGQELAQYASLDQLYELSQERLTRFQADIRALAKAFGGTAITPGLKSKQRAAKKVQADYRGDARRIKDVMRATIVVDSTEEVGAVLRRLVSTHEQIGEARDLWEAGRLPLDGYRDAKVVLNFEGVPAEVQINIGEMVQAKEALHWAYEKRDEIARRAAEEDRPLTDKEIEAILKLNARMVEVYSGVERSVRERETRTSNSSRETGTPLRSAESTGNRLPVSRAMESTPPETGTSSTGTPSTSRKTLSLPSLSREVSTSESIPPRQPGESDKDYAKRTIDEGPDVRSLPEDHASYFETDGAQIIPLDRLVPTKKQRSGDKAAKRMAAVTRGLLSKRAPITVRPISGGRYEIIDGNASYQAALEHGWKAIPADVLDAQAAQRLPKDYFEQRYPHSQPVKVTWEDGDSIYDAVKGLNPGHAIWRAERNWPGAKIEAVTLEEVKKNDPESYREIVRFETYGVAQLPPDRVEVYEKLVPEGRATAGEPVAIKPTEPRRGKLPPTRSQRSTIASAVGALVNAGMPKQWFGWTAFGSQTVGTPGAYSLLDHDIVFREQLLNAAVTQGPGMDRWLFAATAHEVMHVIDHGKVGIGLAGFVSYGSPRLAYEIDEQASYDAETDRLLGRSVALGAAMRPQGDLMGEAWQAYMNGPDYLQSYLSYPFAAFDLEDTGQMQIEVTAQVGSLYTVNPELMKQWLPKWYALMKEVHSHASPDDARRALQKALRASPTTVDSEGVRAGPADRAGLAGTDRESPGDRAAGQGVGGVRPPGRQPRGSPAQGQFDVADPTRWDEFVRTFQDNKVDLKRLQEAISKQKAIPEEQDAYLKDEARISRTADKIDRARRTRFLPLLESIREEGLTLDEVERFLHARHAPEANKQIAKVRQQSGMTVSPGLSGMTNAEARRVMDDFRTQGKIAKLRRIAGQVDQIIEETRKIYVSGGLETQDTIDAWKSVYQHYVPLHREGFGELNPAIGKGYTIRGPETKKRVGSKLAVENILANVMAAHEAAIVRAEKNRVDRALWELMRANPNPDFWSVGRPSLRETVDVDTGLPVRVPSMDYKNQQNALVLKIDGQEKVIEFNPRNHRAMELAKALKNLQGSELSWWVDAWSKANRLLANLATAYNPVFWATNFTRDLGTMAFNLQSTELKGKELEVMRQIPMALAGVRNELRGNGKSAWAGYYREAKAAGATTGWMSTFDSIEERADEIAKLLQKAERSKADPREVGEAFLQLVKDYNDVIEHATRTAVYKVARDSGMSKDASASIAKNITVNFNRKGTASSHLGAFYMFFNANVQGTARMLTGAAKSKRLWAYMVTAAGVATALDILNRVVLADDDDDGENSYDKVSSDIKARNLIVMRPGTEGKYWKIPLPYGFNFIAAFGRVIGEFATKRDYSVLEAGAGLAKTAVEAFSPIGQAATPAQVLSPSLIDPVVYILENRDWAGRQIYKEEDQRQPHIPSSEKGLRTTPLWAKSLAREIAEATDGKIEINPGMVASLVSGYTSGLGTTISQTFDVAHRAATGQEIPVGAVPLLNRFAGEQTEGMRARRFFELKEQAIKFDAEVRRLRKDGKTEQANDLERSKPHLRAFMQAYKPETKGLGALYREAEKMETEDLSRAERNDARKDWERRRGEIYSRILRRTNQARP
ncbi:MAG: ParB N-terminal domain-containing protein [Candidatus Eisenbacteria bacterium]|nr:ParB N-terminal domain-containing protein [Candidatus Eisenbacteria bacterium]